MRLLFSFLLLFISINSISQNCDNLFSEDKFTKDKKAYFYMDGIDGYKPYAKLTIEVSGNKSYSNENIAIELSAGTGKKDEIGLRDYTSVTLKYVSQKDNNLMLYFLFEDGKSLYLMGSSQVVYGNAVYFNKTASSELVSYLKTKKVTDIRFIFNDTQNDYHIPDDNQDFFKELMKCINW